MAHGRRKGRKPIVNILFINGGEKGGNTSRMGRELIGDRGYDQIDLADTKVYDYGHALAGGPDDRFKEVLGAVRSADVLVMGSPVYWHDLSGMMRCLLDRFYGPVAKGGLSGKRLFFIFQGEAPTPEMLERGRYTMERFASLYGMTFEGMAANTEEARELGRSI